MMGYWFAEDFFATGVRQENESAPRHIAEVHDTGTLAWLINYARRTGHFQGTKKRTE